MRLCLSCRFVSPSGSLLCGRCGRSFGGRLCPRHHVSPAGARLCVQCSREELTESTLSLPLGWLSRLLAWGIALLLVSVLTHHVIGLGPILWAALRWSLTAILNIRPCAAIRAGAAVLTWMLAMLLLSYLLPGQAGGRLRGALVGTLRWSGRTACCLLLGAGKWLHRRVEGTPSVPDKVRKER